MVRTVHQFVPQLSILPAAQRKLWPELSATPGEFVLYGGTAIALHLGHRNSVDFDFFANADIDSDRLLENVAYLRGCDVLMQETNSLTCSVDRGGSVKISFFGLPRIARLEAPLVCGDTGLQVAPLRELLGTKLATIQKRAEAKDFIDIDAVLERTKLQLSDGLAAALKMYATQFNPQNALKALTYFGDGNLASVPTEIRARLQKAVRKTSLAILGSS